MKQYTLSYRQKSIKRKVWIRSTLEGVQHIKAVLKTQTELQTGTNEQNQKNYFEPTITLSTVNMAYRQKDKQGLKDKTLGQVQIDRLWRGRQGKLKTQRELQMRG